MPEQIYQVGGTLAQAASSYVQRQADIDLLHSLRNGEFCYVFNARQMGKSSLLVHTAHQLRQEGYVCALVDFSRIGCDQISLQQWYSSFVVELVRSLDGPPELLASCLEVETNRFPLQQLNSFVETVLLPYCCDRNIVIFLDEVDSLQHLPFSVDDFFVWMRSCYNQRALAARRSAPEGLHAFVVRITASLFPRLLCRSPAGSGLMVDRWSTAANAEAVLVDESAIGGAPRYYSSRLGG